MIREKHSNMYEGGRAAQGEADAVEGREIKNGGIWEREGAKTEMPGLITTFHSAN